MLIPSSMYSYIAQHCTYSYDMCVFIICQKSSFYVPKHINDVLQCSERHVLWEDAKNPSALPLQLALRLMHLTMKKQIQAGSPWLRNSFNKASTHPFWEEFVTEWCECSDLHNTTPLLPTPLHAESAYVLLQLLEAEGMSCTWAAPLG